MVGDVCIFVVKVSLRAAKLAMEVLDEILKPEVKTYPYELSPSAMNSSAKKPILQERTTINNVNPKAARQRPADAGKTGSKMSIRAVKLVKGGTSSFSMKIVSLAERAAFEHDLARDQGMRRCHRKNGVER